MVNQDDIVPHIPPTSNFLSTIPDLPQQLSAIQVRPYVHVGEFEFIDQDGSFVDRDEPGTIEKGVRLAKLVVERKLKNLFEDHFIKESYVAKVMTGK